MNRSMTKSPLKDEWAKMLNTVLQRAIFARVFDGALTALGDGAVCNNVSGFCCLFGSSVTQSYFESARNWTAKGTSRAALNVSTPCIARECQLVDWKERGHKDECRIMLEVQTGEPDAPWAWLACDLRHLSA